MEGDTGDAGDGEAAEPAKRKKRKRRRRKAGGVGVDAGGLGGDGDSVAGSIASADTSALSYYLYEDGDDDTSSYAAAAAAFDAVDLADFLASRPSVDALRRSGILRDPEELERSRVATAAELASRLANRPSANDLLRAHLLKGSLYADPLVRAAQESVLKLQHRDHLARSLRNRHSIMELISRGILKPDALDITGDTTSSGASRLLDGAGGGFSSTGGAGGMRDIVSRLAGWLEGRPTVASLVGRDLIKNVMMIWTQLEGLNSSGSGASATYAQPQPRNCHSLSLVGRKLILLGGYTYSQSAAASSCEPSVLDPDVGSWQSPTTGSAAGFLPVPRYAHSVVVCGPFLIMYGGYGGGTWLNDTWILDTRPAHEVAAAAAASNGRGSGRQTSPVLGAGPVTSLPPGFTAYVQGHRHLMNSVSIPPAAAAAVPAASGSSSASTASGFATATAGAAAAASAPSYTWYLPPMAAPPPSPRAAHAAVLVRDRMLVFGGNDGTGLYNDTWCLHLAPGSGGGAGGADSNASSGSSGGASASLASAISASLAASSPCPPSWRRLETMGTPPTKRSGHSAVAYGGSHVVLFGGGEGYGAECFNDLFVLDVSCFSAEGSAGNGAGGSGGGSGASADGALAGSSAGAPLPVWLRPSFTGTPPAPRTGHSACVIASRMFVFGGGDARRSMNDLHLLDLVSMAWSRPSDTGAVPVPRAGHSATAVGDYMLVFGGATPEGHCFNDLYVLDTDFSYYSLEDEAEDRERERGVAADQPASATTVSLAAVAVSTGSTSMASAAAAAAAAAAHARVPHSFSFPTPLQQQVVREEPNETDVEDEESRKRSSSAVSAASVSSVATSSVSTLSASAAVQGSSSSAAPGPGPGPAPAPAAPPAVVPARKSSGGDRSRPGSVPNATSTGSTSPGTAPAAAPAPLSAPARRRFAWSSKVQGTGMLVAALDAVRARAAFAENNSKEQRARAAEQSVRRAPPAPAPAASVAAASASAATVSSGVGASRGVAAPVPPTIPTLPSAASSTSAVTAPPLAATASSADALEALRAEVLTRAAEDQHRFAVMSRQLQAWHEASAAFTQRALQMIEQAAKGAGNRSS